MGRGAIATCWLLTLALAILAAPAPARAANTVMLEVSADPAQQRPVTVTITGESDARMWLYVAQHAGDAPCADTAQGESSSEGWVSWDASSAGAAAGSFSSTGEFTSVQPGLRRICAYLNHRSPYAATPVARAEALVSVRRAAATVRIALTPNTTREPLHSITVSGSTEQPRFLYVSAATRDTCGATVGSQGGRHGSPASPVWELALPAGDFSKQAQIELAPARRSTICAYVQDRPYASVPHATAAVTTLTCCAPQAPAIVGSPARVVPFGEKVTLGWTGGWHSSDVLSVSGGSFDRRPDDEDAESAGWAENTDLLEPGTYRWQVTRHLGDYPPVAGPLASFTVVRPPVRRLTGEQDVRGEKRGRGLISLTATPFADISLVVTRDGKTVLSERFVSEHRSNSTRPVTKRFSIPFSCGRPGTYRWRAVASSEGGTRRAKGGWRVATCAEIRAWQREAARARAQDERREAAYRRWCRQRGGQVVNHEGSPECWAYGIIIVVPFRIG